MSSVEKLPNEKEEQSKKSDTEPRMQPDELKARIKELAARADEAYKKRDFAAEDIYDKERFELLKRLEAVQPKKVPEPLLTEANLKPHTWDPKIIKQFGNARCEVCGMQFTYYKEGMEGLSEWPAEEKEQEWEKYNQNMQRYSCKHRK